MLKDYSLKEHQPITFKEILEEEAAEERRRQEEVERPIREAEEIILKTHRKLHELGKQAALKGQPDPGYEIPESTKALRMTVAQAKTFVAAEAKRFVEETPEYFRCNENVETINNYLTAQGVNIPNFAAYQSAWERLRSFGLIKEHPPEPEPQTVPVEQPVEPEEKQSDDLTPGWDPETGEERLFTAREIYQMDSETYRRCMKMWVDRDGTDRRPRIDRTMYL
jgi:hypothetical protein